MRRRTKLPVVPVQPKLVRRASRMGMEDLVGYIDTSLSQLNEYFSVWRSQREPALIDETMICTQSVYALLEELGRRRPGVEPQGRTRRARQTKTRVVT